MILLTVGTCPHQFDRLVRAVDVAVGDGIIDDEIFAQTGACNYKPVNMQYSEMLAKTEFDEYFAKASCIIGHAGMGTISMSLDAGKPLLVMARMAKYKEHVNDHQVSTAKMFEAMGHILVAWAEEEIPGKVAELRSFKPQKREATPGLVADRIGAYLNTL